MSEQAYFARYMLMVDNTEHVAGPFTEAELNAYVLSTYPATDRILLSMYRDWR